MIYNRHKSETSIIQLVLFRILLSIKDAVFELFPDFSIITEYPDVFPKSVPNELPPLREPHMRHRIKLIDPEKIINPQVIPIAEKYYSQFREHMTKNLDFGRIYPSSSSQASAMFCVPKPANLQIARFVTDF